MNEDLKEIGLGWKDAKYFAGNVTTWMSLITSVPEGTGGTKCKCKSHSIFNQSISQLIY